MISFTQTIIFSILPFTALEKSDQDLLREAASVRHNAQAPYSGYHVGSAVKTTEGTIHCGCNVERCSYSQTTHAEQNAIDSMVGQLGSKKLEKVAIAAAPASEVLSFEVTGSEPTLDDFPTPCGHCLQIIWENAGNNRDLKVMSIGPNGYVLVANIGSLLPLAFGPSRLGIEY